MQVGTYPIFKRPIYNYIANSGAVGAVYSS